MVEKGNTDIFEGCKFDVDVFLEKFSETRCLSKQEIMAIYSYCETAKEYNFSNSIILGSGRSACDQCLFKIDDGRWIVWETDERRGFNSAREFDDVVEACLYLIFVQKNVINENQCEAFFNNILDSGMANEEIEAFSQKFDYTISKLKRKNK